MSLAAGKQDITFQSYNNTSFITSINKLPKSSLTYLLKPLLTPVFTLLRRISFSIQAYAFLKTSSATFHFDIFQPWLWLPFPRLVRVKHAQGWAQLFLFTDYGQGVIPKTHTHSLNSPSSMFGLYTSSSLGFPVWLDVLYLKLPSTVAKILKNI